MMDVAAQAARVKAALDIKYSKLITDGRIMDIVLGSFGDYGQSEQPDISIHLSPSQKGDNLVEQIWRETLEYRDEGIDVRIYHSRPDHKDLMVYRG
jgi:hypothetical protein